MKVMCSWSGGKDSCFALMKSVEKGGKPKVLLNMMNENGEVSRSHGLALEVLKSQAEAMDLPLVAVPATWKDYERNYIKTLCELTDEYELEGAVFGDIDIEPNRKWEEMVSEKAGITAVLPLWKSKRVDLVKAMITSGIEAVIVSCNKTLGEAFLGRRITEELLLELTALGVDECGENGEYHTAVIDCPLFKDKIVLPKYKKMVYDNYCFLTW